MNNRSDRRGYRATQADPRYGMEGTDATVRQLPQAHQSRQPATTVTTAIARELARLRLGHRGSSAAADDLTAGK